MTGVHCLEHVNRLTASHLADDDPVGSHTQGISHEIPLCDSTLAFDVRWTSFESDDVRLLQLQFGRVFYRDNPLVGRDERGESIQQRGLTGASAPGNHHVQPRSYAHLEEDCYFACESAVLNQLRHLQRIGSEATN